MDHPEYVRMNLSDFTGDVIHEYNQNNKATKGIFVIAQCNRAVYGLPQLGNIVNKYLKKRLNEYGFHQSTYTMVSGNMKQDPLLLLS